jgi:hypothetical protein
MLLNVKSKMTVQFTQGQKPLHEFGFRPITVQERHPFVKLCRHSKRFIATKNFTFERGEMSQLQVLSLSNLTFWHLDFLPWSRSSQ